MNDDVDMAATITEFRATLANPLTDLITISFFKPVDLFAQYAGMASIEAMIAYSPTNLAVGVAIHQIIEFEAKYMYNGVKQTTKRTFHSWEGFFRVHWRNLYPDLYYVATHTGLSICGLHPEFQVATHQTTLCLANLWSVISTSQLSLVRHWLLRTANFWKNAGLTQTLLLG